MIRIYKEMPQKPSGGDWIDDLQPFVDVINYLLRLFAPVTALFNTYGKAVQYIIGRRI